jgi:hypothetical protein
MKRLPMVWLAAALLGCATTRSAAPGADSGSELASGEEGRRLVCRREKVVGSHRKQRVCQYEEDRKRQRVSSQEGLGKSRSGATQMSEQQVIY